MNKNLAGDAREIVGIEPAVPPPNVDIDKLKALKRQAAIEMEKCILRSVIEESQQLIRNYEILKQLEEEIIPELDTPELKIAFYSAKQRQQTSGHDFLASREEKFIEGRDTTSQLEKLQNSRQPLSSRDDIDRQALDAVKRTIESAIKKRLDEEKR